MATHEQLARLVGELEHTISELEEENIKLRKAALDFGALAERLNARLLAAERGARAQARPSRVNVRVALDRFANQLTRSWLRM